MHVVIVGGGIIGVSTAYYLTQMSQTKITLIEWNEVAGSSSGKAGGFLALDWSDHRLSGPLSRKSFKLHKELAKSLPSQVDYRELQTYSVYYSDRMCNRRSKIPWIVDGYEKIETLGSEKSTAQVHPKKLTKALLDLASSSGRLTFINKKVTGLELNGLRISGVHCGDEYISADAVVFAMGPWSHQLSNWLNEPKLLKILGGGKRCHSIVMDTVGSNIDNTAIFGAFMKKEYEFYPRPDGTIYVCGEDDDEPLPADPKNVVTDETKIQKIHSITQKTITPLSKAGLKSYTACYIPSSPDSEPIIGPLEKYEGIFVGCGFNVWGILNGPGAGLSLAEYVLKKELSIPEVRNLAPNRF